MGIDQAMILAAGYGKRLRPLTDHTPKPLVLVHGQPLMARTLSYLRDVGVNHVGVNTHHLAAKIHSFLETDPTATSLKTVVSHEHTILETGGGILKALPLLRNAPFFSVNGDVWWQKGALEGLAAVWNERTMDALLLMVPRAQCIGYQGVGDYNTLRAHITPSSGTFLIQHRERSAAAEVPYVYGGVQIIHPRLFDDAKQDDSLTHQSFSLRILYDQAEAKQRLYGLIWDAPWCDIGTPEALQAMANL